MSAASSALDAAVANLLLADATLQALLPDGVYFDQVPQNGRRFVWITKTPTPDVWMFPDAAGNVRAFEEPIYIVLAVVLASSGDIQAAGDRVDALLDGVTITADGYAPAMLRRLEPVRRSERDAQDASQRWLMRGGEYTMTVAPL